jgi:CheY-like chemotaxis protein
MSNETEFETFNTNMSASAQNFASHSFAAEGTVRTTDAIQQRRILLVDEEAHVLRVMRLNLDRHGYEVDTALSSEAALQLLREQRYDVLIMSGEMPDMSAHQLCKSAAYQLDTEVPLILIMACDGDGWIDDLPFVERLDEPLSLRWIVARLSESFGDYE